METIYRFGDRFLVECPQCSRCALVVPAPTASDPPHMGDPRRLVCRSCGCLRDAPTGKVAIGAPRDWYLGLSLWLQTPCCGDILWATNPAHLAWLDDFVGALQRKRTPLSSRLPAWMKSAHHREEVLKGLARLRRRLEVAGEQD